MNIISRLLENFQQFSMENSFHVGIQYDHVAYDDISQLLSVTNDSRNFCIDSYHFMCVFICALYNDIFNVYQSASV